MLVWMMSIGIISNTMTTMGDLRVSRPGYSDWLRVCRPGVRSIVKPKMHMGDVAFGHIRS